MRRLLERRQPGGIDLQPVKCRAIDAAFERVGAHSFADLGGVWGVGAGYTFYAVGRAGVERGVLVDTGITDTVRRRASSEPRLTLLDADLGHPATPHRVGEVDVVLLFDVLLHQVDPGWDEIVRRYASRCGAMAIVQPQYVAGSETVRLLDLSRPRYEALVPDSPVHAEAWDRLDEIHPRYGRPWRDIHEIWQWGIVDADLDEVCRQQGFELVHYENAGPWMGLEAFENHAFVYVRGARRVWFRGPGR
ncbi:MAG: hypothetical protein ACRD29_24285 [Acidimicrobiales bacterium]